MFQHRICKQDFPVACVGYRNRDLIDTILLEPVQHDSNIDTNIHSGLYKSFLFFFSDS